MITGNYSGGIEAAIPVALSGTSTTDIYTAAAGDNSSTLASFAISNNSGSAIQVKCYYYDGSTDHLFFTRSIPANDTEIVTGLALRLRGGYKFKAQSATGGSVITVTAIISRSHPNERNT